MNCGRLPKRDLEWASENIPKLNTPSIYYSPLVAYLKDNGIKFKDWQKYGYIEPDLLDSNFIDTY
jgi:hypothetical protein